MKSFVWVCVIGITVFANEGKILFTKHCLSCHIPFIAMSKLKENFLDHNNTLLNLKAPTLNQLSYRLKQQVGDRHGEEDLHRMEVTAFMSDYVMHPDKDKSVCLEDVLQHFKTMPSLKGSVSEEELEKIGTYVYDFDKDIIRDKSVRYEGFEKVLETAKREDKMIMIKVMTKGCHYCRKMEGEVMTNQEVIEAIDKDFISLPIDISIHQLPLGLKAKVTPSFIFIDAKAQVLMNVPGAWDKEDFILLLKEAKFSKKKDMK